MNDLGEVGSPSKDWVRVGLHLWLQLGGISERYCWGCGLPLGACQYLCLILVTISKGYRNRVNFVLPG